jgi:hypothetical protein
MMKIGALAFCALALALAFYAYAGLLLRRIYRRFKEDARQENSPVA